MYILYFDAMKMPYAEKIVLSMRGSIGYDKS